MLVTHSIDLEKKEYLKYFNAIKISLKENPLPGEDDPEHYRLLKNRLSAIFPSDYIVILSSSLEFNIQTLKKSSWIFMIYSAKVIAYKPKAVTFPQLLKCPPITKEDLKNYVTENNDPFLTSLKLIKNSLFDQTREAEIIELIKVSLNKNAESKDPVSQMMVYVKQFSLIHLETLFIHIVIGNSKDFQISFPSDGEKLEEEQSFLEIDFKVKSDKNRKKLFVFEKKGEIGTFSQRVTDKWKECLLVLAFVLVLLLITKCNNEVDTYLGLNINGICKNKSFLVYFLVSIFVGFIFLRHFKKSKEKIEELKKKKKEKAN